MERTVEFAAHLVAGLGQAALVVILFSIVSRLTRQRGHSQLWFGLLFGAAAIASMAHPIRFAPGIMLDPRAVMLALAGPFGGPGAAVISMAMASAMRIFMGGQGVLPGVAGILIAGGVGIAHRHFLEQRTDLKALLILGAASALYLASLLLLPADVALAVFTHTAPWLVLTNFIGIVVIGTLLAHELRFEQKFVTMQSQVMLDALTGLANRRALIDIEERLLKGMSERAEGYAIVLFDIDHFKSVNDRWGHVAGDAVLRGVAEQISSCIRSGDVAVRYGGEELLLLLQGASAEGALGLAETIRERLEHTRFRHDGQSIRITVSAGVSTGKPNDLSLSSAIRRADEALYRAKSKGRNCTEVYYRIRESA
ncbi:GGDEF domain-containing protein [Martelella endophytica]|uniref:GGDEF domain-containing protein n=1 Tax=Martelella endophytica TaxID=1486262 RepID=UPI0005F0CAFE|nr:diguanylate cyclase [Martelella endophytica]